MKTLDGKKVILSDEKTFLERVLLLVGNEKPHSWARRHNIGKNTMQGILKGRIPRKETIERLCESTGVDPDWLLYGDETTSRILSCNDANLLQMVKRDFCFVPKHETYDVDGSPTFFMAFRRYWIEKYLECSESDLIVVSMDGNAMHDTLMHRDILLVNKSFKTVQDGLYFVKLSDESFVKYIQCLPDGRFELSNKNQEFGRSFVLNLNEFEVIGKIVWFGRPLS